MRWMKGDGARRMHGYRRRGRGVPPGSPGRQEAPDQPDRARRQAIAVYQWVAVFSAGRSPKHFLVFRAPMAQRALTVVGKVFAGKNKDGDFKWMVRQKQYANSLFVITENYLDSVRDDYDEGAGTAVLRPLCPQRVQPGTVPRAVGVPTGWSVAAMGFPNMDTVFTKTAIDLSLDRIAVILDEYPQFSQLVSRVLVRRRQPSNARRQDL